MLFCIGCSSAGNYGITPVLDKFKCDFSVEESEISGEIEVDENGTLTILFTGGDIINGIKMQVKEETLNIDVNGISEVYSRNEMPKSSPAFYIYDALIAAKQLTPSLKNEKFIIAGDCQSGPYILTLNDTGFIEKISPIGSGLNFCLTNHVSLH